MLDVAFIWKKVMDLAPEMAFEYGPKIVKLIQSGVISVQDIIKLSDLKMKNSKKDKLIEEYYKKIGKSVCDNQIKIDNAHTKDIIGKVKDCLKDKKDNDAKIEEIYAKIKNYKIVSDAKDLGEKIFKKSNAKKKTATKVKGVKKSTKTTKTSSPAKKTSANKKTTKKAVGKKKK